MKSFLLYLRTAVYLKPTQIWYRFFYALRGQIVPWRLRIVPGIESIPLALVPGIDTPSAWMGAGRFQFLNDEHNFGAEINWNYPEYGKLWTYNLNYFDFLHQPDMDRDSGLLLIRHFIAQSSKLKDGLEPYPISLRLINWVLFLSRNKIDDQKIHDHLYAQYRLLWHRREYHLLGNHLLENGFALFTGAIYFADQRGRVRAWKLLHQELDRQILTDGGHDERSPMYQQIIVLRLLHTINVLQGASIPGAESKASFLKDKAAKMLGWLDELHLGWNRFPQVNDCALGISPDLKDLQAYADRLGVGRMKRSLSDSGYRVFRTKGYTVVADAGPIGPDHQPGHGHCDTLSFVMDIHGMPFLVDTGTSTYEEGPRRLVERSTQAHNTVKIEDLEQSEMWAAFRVARRSRPRILRDEPDHLEAVLGGIPGWKGVHHRSWSFREGHVEIKDSLQANEPTQAYAYFHFAPQLEMHLTDEHVDMQMAKISFSGALKIESSTYLMADGFNRLVTAPLLSVKFSTILSTKIQLKLSDPSQDVTTIG